MCKESKVETVCCSYFLGGEREHLKRAKTNIKKTEASNGTR
jgi:hypothetical protein